MLKLIDQLCGALLVLTGLAHMVVGASAFTAPTEPRIWFLSAGIAGATAGLVNLARARDRRPSRLLALAALAGAAGILTIGSLLILAGTDAASRGPALVVFAVGLACTAFSLRDIVRR